MSDVSESLLSQVVGDLGVVEEKSIRIWFRGWAKRMTTDIQ